MGLIKHLLETPLGQMTMVSDSEALQGLYFSDQVVIPKAFRKLPYSEEETTLSVLVANWIETYFSGLVTGELPVPIKLNGTDFQKQVWQAMLNVPYGETITYGQLAEQLNCQSAQAIGGAIRKNPILLLIPCHRVVGANGQMTGYVAGVDRKVYLLEWEKQHAIL